MGSDYPFGMGEPDPVAFLKGSGVGPGLLDALLSGNAARFLAL